MLKTNLLQFKESIKMEGTVFYGTLIEAWLQVLDKLSSCLKAMMCCHAINLLDSCIWEH